MLTKNVILGDGTRASNVPLLMFYSYQSSGLVPARHLGRGLQIRKDELAITYTLQGAFPCPAQMASASPRRGGEEGELSSQSLALTDAKACRPTDLDLAFAATLASNRPLCLVYMAAELGHSRGWLEDTIKLTATVLAQAIQVLLFTPNIWNPAQDYSQNSYNRRGPELGSPPGLQGYRAAGREDKLTVEAVSEGYGDVSGLRRPVVEGWVWKAPLWGGKEPPYMR
ncbi:hypothetical protein AK830_g3274 [Neonectria ditissima]|uniref:Uncharacterized protein n=1 Tax=Neonectria ditissima TaxID=78410 RepID=A0A0P7BR02_9HYPO|nr:hypothetical protein AK830_g3274 [Neonectria ditissima]